MIKVTRTSIRPNTDVPFYVADVAFIDYFRHTYEETGLVTAVETTLSEDGLTKSVVNIYVSEEVMIQVRNDQVVIDGYTNKSKKYNLDNGITVNALIEEIEQN